MDQSFLEYLDLLELLLFFSGYPLIYLIVKSITETAWSKKVFKTNISNFLPLAYAITGVLYVGLQVKNLYPDFSSEHIQSAVQLPYLKLWALLSILFFIPALSKKIVISFLHSLVFFFFILKDLYFYLTGTLLLESVKNDMNIYSLSLLINFCAFVFMLITFLGVKKLRV